MKKVLVLVMATLLVGISQLAMAQEARAQDELGRQHADGQKLTHDQLRMAVQEICPVSGQKLGAHGKPIKVKIGEEQVFLCCHGCLQQKVNPEHWATIHANFAKAQAKCPVMDKALPDKPKWTIVEGQIVYICCPPCAKKLAADPKTYLQKVDELYSASLEAQTQLAIDPQDKGVRILT